MVAAGKRHLRPALDSVNTSAHGAISSPLTSSPQGHLVRQSLAETAPRRSARLQSGAMSDTSQPPAGASVLGEALSRLARARGAEVEPAVKVCKAPPVDARGPNFAILLF